MTHNQKDQRHSRHPHRQKQKITKHHRKPKSKGGKRTPQNISHVPENKHRAYHMLFADKDVNDIAHILNSVWIDPDFLLVPIRRP